MSGLFVQLDAEYPTDDEFIEAGPMAELLYIRGLCFCKRKMLDGTISRSQLPAVALGIPSALRLAAKLVDVGLWETRGDGWYIAAWLKRNKSAAQIKQEREMRRMASMEANHAQHHVGPGKKRNPRCELCRSEHPPISEPPTEPESEPNRIRKEEPQPEPEEEPQPQPQPEPEEEPSSVSRSDNFQDVVACIVDRRVEAFPTRTANTNGHRHSVELDVERNLADRIRDELRRWPDMPPEIIASNIEPRSAR